jgi:hypothetical protein
LASIYSLTKILINDEVTAPSAKCVECWKLCRHKSISGFLWLGCSGNSHLPQTENCIQYLSVIYDASLISRRTCAHLETYGYLND